jgi:hypothetical protein
MAEDPIKLFSTRAERYPEPTDTDHAQGAARAALAAIPVIGGPITEVLSVVLAPSVARRRDQWFKELADGLEQLEANVEGFKIKNLEHDEEFVSAVIEASRSAISTHKQEKREALRNAMLNIALHRSASEDQQQTFLRYIDELTVWHLRILTLFQDPPRVLATKGIQVNPSVGGAAEILESMYPELNGHREVYDQVVTDLHARGLLNSPPSFLHTTMTGNGMVAKRTSALADAFLAFIADPTRRD